MAPSAFRTFCSVTQTFSEFLPLRALGDRAYALDVNLELCSGMHTLWCGCGLAAGVEAMERATDRPCTWAAVQYLLPIHPDEVLALEVELGGQGRRLTQAQVTGRVEGRLVLVAHGSLGGSGRPTRSSCLLRRTCPLRRSAPAERCRCAPT